MEVYLFAIIGIILIIVYIYKILYYSQTIEGNIMIEEINRKNTKYRYTISYMIDGKTYIHQQKEKTYTRLYNGGVYIKYHKNNPYKSIIKGEEFEPLILGIAFIVFALIIFFMKTIT